MPGSARDSVRDLVRVDASDPRATMAAIRDALSGGVAVLPHDPLRADNRELPSTVGARAALVVETSGSSARPKRVVISREAALAASTASEAALSGPGQWLLALPAFYIAGVNVLLRSISAGTLPIAMGPAGFTADRFVECARALTHPVRFTSLVPVQLATLVESREALDALRRFDRVLLGGQAATSTLVERARDQGVQLTVTYGSTETCGGCVYDGIAVGATTVRVREGQIEISGPTLAEGYLDDPARTDAAFVREDGLRWYRTGDSGELVDGMLTVTGRLDDVIISGGIKVSLGEVESLLRAESQLSDAVVIATSNSKWGEVPVVFSAAKAAASVPLPELRALVSGRLGAAAAPDRIVSLPEIPLLSSGKPDRRALRASLDR